MRRTMTKKKLEEEENEENNDEEEAGAAESRYVPPRHYTSIGCKPSSDMVVEEYKGACERVWSTSKLKALRERQVQLHFNRSLKSPPQQQQKQQYDTLFDVSFSGTSCNNTHDVLESQAAVNMNQFI